MPTWNYYEVFCLLIILFPVFAQSKDLQYEFVTCGSVLKLVNVQSQSRLHSHDVKYGSGSGQQSVTAVDNKDDHNSYWQIRSKPDAQCTRGEPVRCGSTIRFMHLATGRNLHSHHFQSPLSKHQEVSCFGEKGDGDTGDNWAVVCTGDHWSREEQIRLRHVVTGKYLHMTGDVFGRPIAGQKEVCAYDQTHPNNFWTAAEGVFIKPSEKVPKNKS